MIIYINKLFWLNKMLVVVASDWRR